MPVKAVLPRAELDGHGADWPPLAASAVADTRDRASPVSPAPSGALASLEVPEVDILWPRWGGARMARFKFVVRNSFFQMRASPVVPCLVL